VGRKEILDILLAVREHTTVLFSTHILSDVERICTDVAFLDNGTIGIQGKLADIKTKFRKEEYLLETEGNAALQQLLQAFPTMRQAEKNQLIFNESSCDVFDVMGFAAQRRIPLVKLERVEPTLESLFVEVAGK
jgi:ABC-2 type transport system ATP-binding protein